MENFEDNYLWLEDIYSQNSLNWVNEQNLRTVSELEKYSNFNEIYNKSLNILNNPEKIPYISFLGNNVYNFWQDKNNIRGVYRRTTLKSFLSNETDWEIVFDLDEISKEENENWVFKATCHLEPLYERCFLYLSRGGKDASVVREFDLINKKFIANGFLLEEAKQSVCWLNKNSILVSSTIGENSATKSGYGRKIKKLSRGTPYSEAKEIFSIGEDDIGCFILNSKNSDYVFLLRKITRYESEYNLLNHDDSLIKLNIPSSSDLLGVFKNYALIYNRESFIFSDINIEENSIYAINLKDVRNNTFNKTSAKFIFKNTKSKI